MVLLEPNTELDIALYQLINGGVSQGGERHVNLKIVNGGVAFDVVPAESPPNTWAFLTPDGAVTIQGTGGSLSRRVGIKEELDECSNPDHADDPICTGDNKAVSVDTKIELLEGTATMVRKKSEHDFDNEDGDGSDHKEEIQAMVVKPGVAFQASEEKPCTEEMLEADPMLAADVGYIVSLAGEEIFDEEVLEKAAEIALESDKVQEDIAVLQVAALAGPDGVEAIKESGSIDAALEITSEAFEAESGSTFNWGFWCKRVKESSCNQLIFTCFVS